MKYIVVQISHKYDYLVKYLFCNYLLTKQVFFSGVLGGYTGLPEGLGTEKGSRKQEPVTEIIMKNSFKVFITGVWMCALSLSSLFSSANNIRISGTVQVSQGTGDTLVLSFPLRWDNSWRDQFNWDAAWVFLKYKSGTGGWNHVNLCAGGHRLVNGSGLPVPFDAMPGKTGSSTVGLFIYRSTPEAGNTPEINCQVKCLKSSLGGLTTEQFQKHEAFILAQAVETVYVPYGSYYLGDGTSSNSLRREGIYDILNNYSGYEYTINQPVRTGHISNMADHVNQSLYPDNTLHFPSVTESYIQIDFKAMKTIRYFGISGASNYAGGSGGDCRAKDGWQLRGSNDLTNWNTLYTGLSSDWGVSTVSYPIQNVLKVGSPGSYRYYRIVMNGSNRPSDNNIVIQNIAMAEYNAYPLLIDNEEIKTVYSGSGKHALTANYPRGYKGFYVMKYEVSQEQYVSFLNTLTYVQQKERIPGLSFLKEGEFVFGAKASPSNRNGIIVNVISDGYRPVIFTNNLNNNREYSEDGDGKTIACNYLSPSDMLAYCSWSGLRPMSELEYEKASRALYPEEPARGGYAWNTTVLNSRLSGVSHSGTRKEQAQGGGNVNSGGGSWKQGPVRCGIFATGSSTQESAGTSFWGAMELSGNLREMCYNVNGNGAFDGSVIGDGTYNAGKWSATPSYIGVRGGSFAGADSLLRTSDRSEANYFSALTVNTHDSTVGFRSVRPIGSDVTVTQGTLVAIVGGVAVVGGNICPGVPVDITTDSPAKVMSGGVEVSNTDFTYIWYDGNGDVIPGETGSVLHFSNFVSGTSPSVSYRFRRKAICPLGDVTTTVLTLTMPNMSITFTPLEASINSCDFAPTVTASAYCSNPVYTWQYGDKWIKTGNTYVPDRDDFDGRGNFRVGVTVSSGSCTSEKKELQVSIPHIQNIASSLVTMDNCGTVLATDDRDSKRYCTVKIGTQCWMGRNLDVGTYEPTTTNDYLKFDDDGIQKWCFNNLESNCEIYGGLYEWWEAVCGGRCNSNVNTGNAENLTLSSESELIAYGAKMVPGSTTQVQGICPDGWRMPSDGDWSVLETYLGIPNASTTTGFRGTDQGTQMKMPGTYNGSNWCSSTTCNASGLGLLPGGIRSARGGSFSGLGNIGYWWSSTPNIFICAWRRTLSLTEARVDRYINDRSNDISVRCVRN